MRKYDIGTIFTLDGGRDEKVVGLIWKYAISMALDDNAVSGNENAWEEECTDPLSVAVSEHVGLKKIAINCGYSI